MASSPQRRQRMPVSRPSRASSKKIFRLITRSVTAEQAHDDRRGVAPERMGQAGAGAVHLTPVRLTAELGDDLRDLGRPGGTDRVALGLEPAGWIHRELAPEARPALLRGEAAG